MRLTKDYFSLSEIKKSSTHIVQNVCKFMEENNLSAYQSTYDKKNISFNSSNAQTSNYSTKIQNSIEYIRSNLEIVDSSQQSFPKISINIAHNTPGMINNETFYAYLYKNAQSETEKKVLVKTFFHYFCSRYNFIDKALNNMSNEDYWFHLRNIIPFNKSGKSLMDARAIFSSLSQKSIDTPEKINALLYTIQHYKQICKREDVSTGLSKLLISKVSEDKLSIFENFLKIKIKPNDSDFDIEEVHNDVLTIHLSKEKTFKQLNFGNIPQPKVDDLNTYLEKINQFLTSEKASEILNIKNIDYNCFSSKKNPARIYIESKEGGFSEDIKPIYLHLVKTCTNKLISGYKQESLLEALNTSLNYFLLNKSVKNKDNQQSTSISVSRPKKI